MELALVILGILAFFICMAILKEACSFKKEEYKERDKVKLILHEKIKKALDDIDPKIADDFSPYYLFFKEEYLDLISNKVFEEFKEYNHKINGVKITKELIDKTLDGDNEFIDKVNERIFDVYANRVIRNIDEGNDIEKSEIEFHKQFGEEPYGDPVLHPHEGSNEEYGTDIMKDKSIEELENSGTIENL